MFWPWETLGHHPKLGVNWLRGRSNPQATGGGWIGWPGSKQQPSTVQFVLVQLEEGRFRFSKWCSMWKKLLQQWGRHSCEQPDCGEMEVVLQEPQPLAPDIFLSGVVPLESCPCPMAGSVPVSHSTLIPPSTAIWNIVYGCADTCSKICIYCSR